MRIRKVGQVCISGHFLKSRLRETESRMKGEESERKGMPREKSISTRGATILKKKRKMLRRFLDEQRPCTWVSGELISGRYLVAKFCWIVPQRVVQERGRNRHEVAGPTTGSKTTAVGRNNKREPNERCQLMQSYCNYILLSEGSRWSFEVCV